LSTLTQLIGRQEWQPLCKNPSAAIITGSLDTRMDAV